MTDTPRSTMLTDRLSVFPDLDFGGCPLPESPGSLKEAFSVTVQLTWNVQ